MQNNQKVLMLGGGTSNSMLLRLMASSTLVPVDDALSEFAVNDVEAALALSFTTNEYRTGNSETTFADAFMGNNPKLTYSTAAGSNSTMVNSSGELVWAPHNLLGYSEDFSQSSVFLKDADVQIGTTNNHDPAGGQTATQINVSGSGRIYANVTSGDYFTSVYIKPGTFSNFRLAGFLIDLGVTPPTNSSPDGSIDVLPNNWFRVTVGYVGNRPFQVQAYPNADYSSGHADSGDYQIWGAHVYRSDLGGMAQVPGADTGFETYVPTNGNPEYLPRVGHHVYNGSTWVNEGLLIESEPRTNLLLNSSTLSTQSVTVAAAAHTLSFTGTGTITLSGVSTDGPLVGTGTGEENRVSLTFTPAAGSLTLTVSGTVSNAQLEEGSTPSSYMPTNGGTYTRTAQSLTVPAAEFGWNSDAVSIQMDGRMTYADEGVEEQQTLFAWGDPTASNYIVSNMDTDSTDTGEINFEQDNAGTTDTKTSDAYSPGVNVPFNISSRHGSTFVNGAVDGVALTADTTPTALPDLSSTNLEIAPDFMGTIGQFRQFEGDIGDAGLEEATS